MNDDISDAENIMIQKAGGGGRKSVVEIAGSGDEQSGADFAPSSEAGKDTVSVHPMHGFSGRRRETPVRGAGYEPEMSSSQSQVFSRWSWVGRHGSHKGIVTGRQPRRVASPEQRTTTTTLLKTIR
jgi:hypothetical protein